MGTVLVGNMAGSLMGFAVGLLAIRNLVPSEFGLFSLAVAVMGLLSQGMELGLTTGFVKFASQYMREQGEKSSLILLVALKSRLVSGVLLLVIGYLAADLIGRHIFRREGLETLLRLAFVGGFGALMFGFTRGVLQARQWFRRFAFLGIWPNLLRLSALALLLLAGAFHLGNVILVYILSPVACFLISWAVIPRDFLKARGDHRGAFWEIFHFSKWVTLSNIATMIILRLDVFMLTSMRSSEDVAFYVGASQLAYVFPILTGSITQALLPKATALSSADELRSYVRGGLRVVPWALVIFVPLIFLAGPIVGILYGDQYVHSIPIFRILIVGFMISVMVNPMSLLLYTLNRAELLAILNGLQLILNVSMNLWLIPSYGATGAAISSLSIRLLAALFIGYFIQKLVMVERRQR
jgi:O-antigen/teichoic acid export membrane protein